MVMACDQCVFVAEGEDDVLLKQANVADSEMVEDSRVYMVYSVATGFHYMDFETDDGRHDSDDYRINFCPICGRKFIRYEP